MTTLNTHKQYALFLKQINSLKPWHLTALTAAVSERALPNFLLFSEITEFGDPSEVRHTLNMLWDNVAGLQSAKNFERLFEKLDDNTPELDDFDMFGVHPALDVIVGLNCCVNCAMQNEAPEAEAASALTLSLSTIGKFIKYIEASELNGVQLTQYIEQHGLYTSQLEFIDSLIALLKKTPKQNKDFARSLQKEAANEGISQLGISLE